MIDLHCHSTASDGEFSPSELLHMAEQNGVSALALTDHDTTDGLEEFLAAESTIEHIPGIELSCNMTGNNAIHIVGLYVDRLNPALQETLAQIRHWRDDRNLAILEKLKELGMPVSSEEVLEIASKEPDASGKVVIGKPHIAKALCQHGYCKDVRDAFDKYLRNDRPAYVNRRKLEAREGIRLLHDAGAVVIWAHPFVTMSRRNKVTHAIKELMFAGLDGLETIYPDYRPADTPYAHDLAKNRMLLESGGTDFHGPNTRKGIQIGFGYEHAPICVPESFLDAIKEARLKRA